MTSHKTKTLCWDGSRTKFEDFWEDFKIRAVKKKCEGHLSTTHHPDLPSDGEAADLDRHSKKVKKAMKK